MLPPQSESYSSRLRSAMLDLQSRQKQSSFTVKKLNYVELLHNHFKTIPPANLNRRWTIDELCKQFSGRYSERPATRVIAAALRELGFTCHRDWTAAGRNCRYWQPNLNIKEKLNDRTY